MQFTASPMTLAHVPNDVAAADLNGDGRIDLVVAASDVPEPAYKKGYATVLIGTGSGTFASPVDYPTAPGAYNVVVGDFNRDGILDIATANRSEIYYDASCDPRQTWDSISILPGTTGGTFTARSDFSIGNQMKPDDTTTDRNTVESLASGDLNGDHAADLVVSNGTVFLNKAADPNWAPTVDAGPDQTINDPGDHFVHLYAQRERRRSGHADLHLVRQRRRLDPAGARPVLQPAHARRPHLHRRRRRRPRAHGERLGAGRLRIGRRRHERTADRVVDRRAGGRERSFPPVSPYTIRWTATAGSAPIDAVRSQLFARQRCDATTRSLNARP